jgi:hypothetical protein
MLLYTIFRMLRFYWVVASRPAQLWHDHVMVVGAVAGAILVTG